MSVALAPRKPVARQIMLRLAAVGVVLGLLTSLIGTWSDYRAVLERAEDRLDQIESGLLPSIAESAWLQDSDRLEILVQGIKTMPYLATVEVTDETGQSLVRFQRPYEGEVLQRSYPLQRHYLGQPLYLGKLTIQISKKEVIHHVMERAWVNFLSIFLVVTLLLAGLIVLLAPMITQPLAGLAAHARRLGESGITDAAPFPVVHTGESNEFTDLAQAFNDMRQMIQQSIHSLKASEARHRSLFTSSPVSLWEEDFSEIKDALTHLPPMAVADISAYLEVHPATVSELAGKVRVLDVNEATLTLLHAQSKEQLLAHLHRTYTPQFHDAFRRQLAAIQKGERSLALESRICTLKGDLRDVVVHWQVADGHQERLERVIIALEDVTEWRSAERSLSMAVEKLTAVNSDLERFTFAAAHDLQEPIRGIVSFSQLLQRHLKDTTDPDTASFLAFLVSSAVRLQGQIQGLQAFSQVAVNSAPFSVQDLGLIIERVHAFMADEFEERQATLEYADIPPVSGDSTQLAELLRHLLGNALKFARDGMPPRIRISGRARPPFVEVVVEDNGIGIPPDYIGEVFAPFRRLHGPDLYPGAGMGLAVSRRIVERHGGRIRIDPEYRDGTRVVFTLFSSERPYPGP